MPNLLRRSSAMDDTLRGRKQASGKTARRHHPACGKYRLTGPISTHPASWVRDRASQGCGLRRSHGNPKCPITDRQTGALPGKQRATIANGRHGPPARPPGLPQPRRPGAWDGKRPSRCRLRVSQTAFPPQRDADRQCQPTSFLSRLLSPLPCLLFIRTLQTLQAAEDLWGSFL
jgi:hypothetical protein